MKAKRIILIVVVLLLVALVLLFYVQNSATKVNLIFKLPFGLAWTLGSGVQLPVLLLAVFLAGMLVSAGILGGLVLRANKKARELERQSTSLKDELEVGRRRRSSEGSNPFPDRPPVDDVDDAADDDWS